MYVLDPVSGARRRALGRDQLVSTGRRLEDGSAAVWRDARNRIQGLGAELRAGMTSQEASPDVLEARVRAGIGRLLRFPRLVRVDADDGAVILTGAVPADEVAPLVGSVRRMRGVRHVDNQLEVYPRPEDIPGVEGPVPPRPPGPRLDLMQRSWSPSTRAVVGALGGLLLVSAPRQHPLTAMALVVSGTLALLRSLTNEPLMERAGAAAGAGLPSSGEPGWSTGRASSGTAAAAGES
jgi:hypothetical protein